MDPTSAADDPLRTDPSLLGRLCDPVNDEAAWAAFLGRYQPVIRGWARGQGLQPADAEDVCQSVMAGLAKSIPAFRYDPASGSFRGWLRAVLTNAVRNFWRGRARHPADVGTGGSDAADRLHAAEAPCGVDDLAAKLDSRLAADYRLAVRAIEEVRAKVKDTTWQAFALTAIDGLTGGEAAARLGIPVASVYIYKARVSKQLRQIVDGSGGRAPGAQEGSA